MKQIPIYQGIQKKVFVIGPSIIENRQYTCAIFSSLSSDDTHNIFKTATATKVEGKVSVVFTFSQTDTGLLKLGDNNLAVYDVQKEMYKVYEAKVYAYDAIAKYEPEEPES